jgi:CRISPR-associated protein Cst1
VLRLTGFVQVDVGVNVITAFAGKTDPAQVTPADLDQIADYLERFYSDGPGQSIAAGIAFTNSGFAQSAWNKPELRYKRLAYASFVLRGHQHLDLNPILEALEKPDYREMVLRGRPAAPPCAFSGDPAYLRISRDMLPMINGRGVINFVGNGIPGLPVADWVLLAIHAMPLGCLISQGRLLAVESDDPELAFEFAQESFRTNLRHLTTAQQVGWKKLPNQSYFRSSLISRLVEIKGRASGRDRAPSLTAYHFTNSGTEPKIDVYPLPSHVVDFVWQAGNGATAAAWDQMVARAWQSDKDEARELADEEPKLTRRNTLYEDLFRLPDDAERFLRVYFLRQPIKYIKNDVRGTYDLRREADLLSWPLTELFLRRMMNVEKERIANIRTMGDKLAEHIGSRNDRRLLRDLYAARDYRTLRLALVRAMQKNGELADFDCFISIFEEGDEYARLDWNLARDLLLIRIFEQLRERHLLEPLAESLDPDADSDAEKSA